ncbi:acid sphingomyelinase-like phosphodiesterase 3b [Mytilus galloprovincialis]|uniref:acid sphingomyelinase-like phosphodiesterase 3b n=1 Tax=Mytilus edulis TaxID=6550 RepID=UPI0039EF3A95
MIILMLILTVSSVTADIGYFWHVTDFHWDHTYMSEDLSCNDVVETYGLYGDYWCDAPWKLVNDSVEAMKALKPDPDFILWTGDNTLHTSDDNVNFEIHDAILGNITNLLKDVFTTVPVYATFGNHDYFPHNQFPETGNLLYNRSFDRWKSWIGEESMNTFLRGGYYTLKTATGMRIVGLNTNLYYTSNKQTGTTEDPAGQFVWLEQVLDAAKVANEKVLVTAHVPPGVNPTPNRIPWMYPQYNSKLNNIFMNYTKQIVGMHFGHEHSDNFRIYHDDTGVGVLAQFCAPSITPWRYKFDGRTGPAHNPSFRLLKYDRSNGNLLDFTQYYMDLPEVNRNNQSEWKIEYNATTAYELADLSPASMAQLVTRMRTQKNHEFQSFRKFWTVSVNENYEESCDEKCHAGFYCNSRHLEKDSFENCFNGLTTSVAPFHQNYNVFTFSSLVICSTFITQFV